MSLRQVLLIIALAVWCLNITFTCNTNSDPVAFNVLLPVRYFQQEYCNFCAAACVQMWGDYDGMYRPQLEIASYMNIVPNGPGALPLEVERAVGRYTASYGYLAMENSQELGAQGDLISSTIEALKFSVPSIMPFDWGEHAVLIIGHEWREKADGTPFAISSIIHDPSDNRSNITLSASQLGYNFRPTPFSYWVILGEYEYYINGTFGHDSFVMQNGTYYGGPAVYNPKGLDTGIPTN